MPLGKNKPDARCGKYLVESRIGNKKEIHMHSISNTMAAIADRENVRRAFMRASLGKRNRADVAEALASLDYHVEVVHQMLIDGSWKFPRHNPVEINDGIILKKRRITKPDYRYEQVMHHCIVQVLAPTDADVAKYGYQKVLNRGYYEYSCGSIPGRGSHYGLKYIKKVLRKDQENTRYFLKMDIRHFFDSVPHRILKEKLHRVVKDQDTLRLLYDIIDCYKCSDEDGEPRGIPLGYYTSQWFANFYLTDLDHYIKQSVLLDVKAEKEARYRARMAKKGIKRYRVPNYKPGAAYMVRYMDDIVIFGASKKELHLMQRRISSYLQENLGLEMKYNWCVRRFEYEKDGKLRGSRLDFMGFVFTRHCVYIRKSILYRATKKARKLGKKSKVNWHDASSMLSRIGYFVHTDTYNMYQQHVKPYVCKRKLREIVSKHNKKRRDLSC